MNPTNSMMPTTSATPRPSLSQGGLPMWAQRALAVVAFLALVLLVGAIVKQVDATKPASRPADTALVQGGPYALTVELSSYPANAGYAMSYAIFPTSAIDGKMTYSVSAVPAPGVDATPVNGSTTPDPKVANRASGSVEITVQGNWDLRIVVNGPSGQGIAMVPIFAKAPPAMPTWLAWPLGLIPVIGLALFFLAQRRWAAARQVSGEPAQG